MTTMDLLRRLQQRDVTLRVQEGRLRVSAPDGVLDDDLLAELRSQRDVLIALLAADRATVDRPLRAIRTPLMPCSPAQRRFWLQQQLAGPSAAYNLPVALRLSGPLDVAALGASLDRIVRRHEILRTVFVSVDGEPQQKILEANGFPLPLHHIAADALSQHLQAQTQRVMDLARGPLFEAQLLRLAPETHVLLLTLHHIVSDGWSLGVLMSELEQGYRADVCAEALPLQYADYAVWQTCRSSEMAAQLDYWRQTLAASPALINLPLDRLRPARQSLRGSAETRLMPVALAARLNEFARSERASLFMLLLAGFKVLLARLSGEEDLVVGTPVANRPLAELETLIGLFVNTLALRSQVSAQQSLRALLRQVRDTTLAAYANQELPFEQLVEALNPPRSLAHAPLFQVMFALHNMPAAAPHLPGLHGSVLTAPRRHAKFDLALSLEETPDGLVAELEYASDLFDAATIQAWLQDYQDILAAAIATPDAPIATLGQCDAQVHARRIAAWAGPLRPLQARPLAPAALLAQVRRQPHAVAVWDSTGPLDYASLAAQSGRLARQLRARGLGRESRVGLCLPRSAGFVVAALAVWRAGAAFVALDASYPTARLRYQCEDAALACVLGVEETAALCAGLGPPVLRVDALASADDTGVESIGVDNTGMELAPDIDAPIHPAQLAYVVYTSGSTGAPKGALISHGALRNLLQWYEEATSISASDRCGQIAQLGFDGSVMEIWGCLCAGAQLHIPDDRTREQPERLAAWLHAQHISLAYMPTPLAEAVMGLGVALPRLRRLMTGGDQLKRRPAQNSGYVLDNLYGPSEAAVIALGAAVPPLPAPIRIGRPIANLRAYVLDARLRPVGCGVAGELFLAGPSLARGYLDRAALSAERFLPDPFASGERMYRTGDRVRCTAAGEYEFLGRVDRQIKLRGFRIEPGEIENTLMRQAGVRNAVVELRATPSGAAALVAYIEPDSNALTPQTLQQVLRESLPAHMLPSAWVLLAQLPLSPSGKLDRRALPDPVWQVTPATPDAAPLDALEQRIALLWSELLGVDGIGPHDDFFALGGHSLLAMRLLARLQREFGVELPLAALFDAPSVAGLARQLRERPNPHGDVIALQPRSAPLPLSFAQQRLWFLAQLEPAGTAYHMPLAVKLHGALDVERFAAAFDRLVQRHEALRTRFVETDGEAMQCFDHEPRLQRRAVPAVDLTAQLDAFLSRPFDLTTDALLRACLLQLDDGNHVFALVVHHIIADGASLALLARELGLLYSAADNAGASALPALPLQYADYAAWQRGGDSIHTEQLEWWKKTLDGLPAALDLPLDRPRTAAAPAAAAAQRLTLDADLTRRLRALAQEHRATLFMTLLAAFKLLLSRLSGQHDVCVGTPMSNRGRAELEGVFGLFVGTLALRSRREDGFSFAQWLDQVRQTALDAYAHQDVPFERIVEALAPPRELGRHPLFQVFFNMPGAVDSRILDIPGITPEPLPSPNQAAKFDLTLYAFERGSEIELQLHYDARIFDPLRSAEMVRQLQGLLIQAVDDPHQQAAAYSLRTTPTALPDPRQPLPSDWHGGMAERFRASAEARAGHEAVADPRRSLTYAALDRSSNRLARRLLAQGIGPGDVVALHATRRVELAVALIAVIKTGAAFMILDAAYPSARVLACLETLTPAAWLNIGPPQPVTPALQAQLDALRWCGVLEDAEHAFLDESAAALPLPEVGPDSLSHIAFTSGSTGRPKAVAGRHSAFTHFLPWLCERFGLHAQDRYSVLSGLSHDPLQRDLLLPLLTGATACLPDPEHLVPGQLARWMHAQRISVANLTPAMAGVVADAGDAPALDTLRCAFVVGDVLRRADVQKLVRHCPGCEIVSFYGATETQWALGYQPADASATAAAVVPLGQGFPGVQLLLLNPAGVPAGVGEVAEVCIRSPHIARGYVDAAPDHAARFAAHPFAADAQDRLYRTGDLGRYAPDGSVHGLGRADRQISLRGLRVELGDIEAALLALPGVHQACALALADADGTNRLVGFVVPGVDFAAPDHGAGHAHCTDWRAALRRQLPDALLPSLLLPLPQLPLTPNGKLDRASLQLLAQAQATAAAPAATPPRTALERSVLHIIGGVLGADALDAGADFFAAGGNSLGALRVVAQLRERFGVAVPLRQLFETPTPAALSHWLAQQGVPTDAVAAPTLAAIPPVQGEAPLSFAQQRLWFLQQLDPDSAAYNMVLALRLQGELDQAALSAALADLCARQASLRTCFPANDGRPRQQVLPPQATFALDYEPCDDADLGARLHDLVAQPFALAQAAPLRVRLYRLDPQHHALVLCVHHIISDGWSMGVLAQDLASRYAAHTGAAAATLPPLPCSYADFAAWQRSQLPQAEHDRLARFWRAYLDGQPPLLALPTDRPRPPQQSHAGAQVALAIDAALALRLRRFCHAEGVTPFMLLLAVLQTLLARYSASDDIAVGFPSANRDRADTESLVGLFADTLLVRARPQPQLPFRRFLQQVREHTLAVHEHAALPFEAIVDLLQPERSLAHAPLFQVMLNLQNQALAPIQLPGLTLQPLAPPAQGARFDLTLVLREDDGFRGVLEYATDLFDAATARQLAADFLRLLQAAIAQPETPLLRLPLNTGTATARATLPAPGLVEAVQHHAAATPQAVALIATGEHWDYATLNAAANRLARHLRRLGVGAEDRIGLLLPRTAMSIAALLGVLKSGAAYVPLDPASPTERLQHAVADAGLRLLLTTTELRGAAGADIARLCLDEISLDGESADDLNLALAPAQLAYGIYTSGTSGRPKAALLTHAGLANLAQAQARLHGVTRHSRVLQLVSGAFDVASGDTALALTQGAVLVIAPEAARRDLVELRELLQRERITHLQIPVALLAKLEPDGLPELQVVVGGGEDMPAQLPPRWAGRARLYNAYGPTEASVMASCGRQDGMTGIDIGSALEGVHIHVLDAALQPQPVGVYGELFIGGAGVGRGYLGQTGLTAASFLPDIAVPGARMYRSGDIGRWRQDGRLEIRGRADQQIKLRGYRIEPGEIEAVLRETGALHEAAVVVREDRPGLRQLVAYVVAGDDLAVDVQALAAAARRRLMDYMLPQHWVVLAGLPLTANGKLDRRALPAPATAAADAPVAALGDGVASALAAIWCRLLGLDRVAPQDNFFALGGDSILSIQVVAAAAAAGWTISPKQIFECQTLAALAAVAVPRRAVDPEQGEVSGPVPFTPIQHWFFEHVSVQPHHWNQGVLLQPRDGVLPHQLDDALALIQRQHDALRMRLDERGGTREAWLAPAVDCVPLRQERLAATGDAFAAALDRHAASVQGEFRFDGSPLFAAVWYESADGGQRRLWLLAHHLLVDAVSWRIVLDDLQTLLRQPAGEALPLPAKTCSYPRWARRLQQQATSPTVCAERDFWLAQEPPRAARLPLQTGSRCEADIGVVRLALPREETAQLLRSGPAGRINTVLLAALALAWRQWTGDDFLSLALEGHGRDTSLDDIDLSRSVGWFTITHPLLLRLPGGADAPAALQAVQTQLAAVPDRGLGYGLLRASGQLPATALPPLSFNYLGQFDAAVPTEGSFALAPERCGHPRARAQPRLHEIDLVGLVSAGVFSLEFRYGKERLATAAVQRLADAFATSLRELLHGPVPLPLPSAEAAALALVPLQPEGDLPPLFCVHPAGGSVACYQPLAAALGPAQPLYGLQAPALAGAAPALPSFEAMAAFYIAALRTRQPHGPYRLLGWSQGGTIAFEIARQLRRAGEHVALLALIDSGFSKAMLRAPSETVEDGADLPTQAAELSLELRQRLHAMQQEIATATAAYEPGCYDGEVLLWHAREAELFGHLGPGLGWDAALARWQWLTTPGSHYTCMQPPQVGVLAAQLGERLAAVAGAAA